MKSIPFAIALTVSMATLAGPVSAEPANWGCTGGSVDRDQLSARSPNRAMERVLKEYQVRWDAAHVRQQCEAFARGQPHEIGCLRGRRDWDAIEAMVPDELWGMPRKEVRPYYLALQEEDDGYKAALDYCREVGAIPKGWVR